MDETIKAFNDCDSCPSENVIDVILFFEVPDIEIGHLIHHASLTLNLKRFVKMLMKIFIKMSMKISVKMLLKMSMKILMRMSL